MKCPKCKGSGLDATKPTTDEISGAPLIPLCDACDGSGTTRKEK